MPPTWAASASERVAVQVHRGDHVELGRTRQYLLERDVGNRVLDENLAGLQCGSLLLVRGLFTLCGLRALPLFPGVGLAGELLLGKLVAPVAERAFGELHDVPLVHDRDALAPGGDRVLDGGAEQAARAFPGDRLDAYP